MKKHIEDLRNALYKHDLTVAAEEDTPGFPAVWTLAHPYFTLPLTIAFHNAHDTGLVPLYAGFGCYLMESPKYRCISPKPTAIRGSVIWPLLSKH